MMARTSSFFTNNNPSWRISPESGRTDRIINGLCSHLTEVDRILAGPAHARVRVGHKFARDRVVSEDGRISSTNGVDVYILKEAFARAINGSDIDKLVLLGLNYHELAHVLFTPLIREKRAVTGLEFLRGSDPRLAFCYNILEDQRIEHNVRQMWPRTTYFFKAAIDKYVLMPALRTPAKSPFVYALVAERRYLSPADRRRAKEIFEQSHAGGKRAAAQLELIVKTYVRTYAPLHSSVDYYPHSAVKLVKELADLLWPQGNEQRFNQTSKNQVGEGQGYCTVTDNTDANHAGRVGQGDVIQIDVYEPIPGDDDAADGAPGDRPGKQGKGDPDPGEKSGAGVSNRRHGLQPLRSKSESTKEIEAVIKSGELAGEIRQVDDAITEAENLLDPLPNSYYSFVEVDADMRALREDFVRKLEEVQTLADPGWLYRESSGRLNTQRIMRSVAGGQDIDVDTAYDDWAEDQSEALEVAAMLLMDLSGSMSGPKIRESSRAFWVLGSALEYAGAEVQRFGFTGSSFTLDDNGSEKDEPTRYKKYEDMGSTVPIDALRRSLKLLGDSQRKNRVCMVLTDGSWGGIGPECDRVIEEMNQQGIATVMVWFGDGGYTPEEMALFGDYYTHKCQHIFVTKKAESLTEYMRDIVTALMMSGINR